jgi:carbon-monoxide dehydrogenase medium subunit
MRAFAYHAPKSLAEAVAVLEREGRGGRVIAGGTDLLVQAKERGVVPTYVVSLKGVTELADLSFDPAHGLNIGARVALRDVASHPDVRNHYAALATGASLVGSLQIQNRGTVGGNVCNASPSADTAPPLIAAGAVAKIHGADGLREVAIEDFFVGPGRTTLADSEVLVSIHLPPPAPRSGSAYARHTPRQEMDIAIVGVAASVSLDRDGLIADLRIALGAVGPTPFRAKQAEASGVGHRLDDELASSIARIAGSEARPISDQRGSADYRRRLVEVLTRRTILVASAGARAS